MSQTDEFDDDLFMLPNTEDTDTDDIAVGGGDGDIFAFTKEGLAAKVKEDKTFDVQTVPILLVGSIDESIIKGSKPTIKAFMEAGVTERDIVALNGPLVELLLKDRSIDTGVALKHIVMGVEDIKYKSINDLLGEQVAFVIMFHHLFFLANTEAMLSAIFKDEIGVRFDALMTALQPPTGGQNYKNAKTKLDKPQFGVPKDVLTAYWDKLETTYVKTEDTRIKYEDLVGTIISGPKSVLKYLVSSQVKLQAGIRNDTTVKALEGLNAEFTNENKNKNEHKNEQKNEHKNNDVSNISSTSETSKNHNEPQEPRVDLSVNDPKPSAPPVSVVEPPAEESKATATEEITAAADEPKPADAMESKPANATVDESKPANATVDESKPANATVDESKHANATVDESKPANATVDESKPANASAAEENSKAVDKQSLGKNKYGQDVYQDSTVIAAHTTASGNPTTSRGVVKSIDSHGRYVIRPYLVSRPTEFGKTPIKVLPRKVQVTHSVGSITEGNETNNNNNTRTVISNNASDPGQVVPSVRQRKSSRRYRNGVGRRTRKQIRR